MIRRCAICPVPGGSACVLYGLPHLCVSDEHRRMAVRLAGAEAARPRADGATLARVRECPHRGGVLPVSRQAECGCGELTECRAGKGRTPGAVTLDECLGCVTASGR
jgi:hypothetical protein